MFGETFQIFGVKHHRFQKFFPTLWHILENAFASQKIESRHFNLCPPLGKFSPVLIITIHNSEITHFPSGSLFLNIYIPLPAES